jgi:type II secretory pathway component PulL
MRTVASNTKPLKARDWLSISESATFSALQFIQTNKEIPWAIVRLNRDWLNKHQRMLIASRAFSVLGHDYQGLERFYHFLGI